MRRRLPRSPRRRSRGRRELELSGPGRPVRLGAWSGHGSRHPDPGRALHEVHRLLRPGGRLHLLEHGAAPDADVLRWQRRLDPLQRRLAGGCHLSRPVDRLVEEAGFRFESLERFYAAVGPRTFTAIYLGRAVAR